MSNRLTDADLECYLDEALEPERMAAIEGALRSDSELSRRLATINSRRDSGVHSLGAVWRRHRITCPGREQMGSYLLGVLPDDVTQYIEFHLKTVGCRCCQANLADLQAQQADSHSGAETRRRRYFQSSAGYLTR